MKLLEKIKEIYDNHCKWEKLIVPEGYKTFYDYVDKNKGTDLVKKYFPENGDSYLFDKYRDIILKGWYGFSLGQPIHNEWIEFLDKILELLRDSDPTFRIQQIKIKYGGVRFYCSSDNIEDLGDIEGFIIDNLHDDNLIY